MSATIIEGNHPYADAWPMLSQDELAELTADVKANGLREPVVIYGDKILDGRNRYAACRAAGIEPVPAVPFDGDDDDALAFVQSVNNGRRHQTKGSLAASWALSMLAADKRKDGRWAQGSQNSANSRGEAEMFRVCGVIADHAPDLLVAVRDDEMSLNAAHGKAEQARDAVRQRMEREERIAAEEAEAKAFVEQNAPDLAKQVGGPFQTYAEARAIWEQRNREEAARIAAEKAAEAKAKREHAAAMTDIYSRDIGRALYVLGGYGDWEDPSKVMSDFSTNYLNPPQVGESYSLDNLRSAGRFLDALIAWKES